MYDYREAMKSDVLDYIEWNFEDGDEVNEEQLNDDLFIDDGVTGNASGSYTFCRNTAKEYVVGNIDLLMEACAEFCVDYETIGRMFAGEEWETMDVTIRCYLLPQVIAEVMEERGEA